MSLREIFALRGLTLICRLGELRKRMPTWLGKMVGKEKRGVLDFAEAKSESIPP